MVSQTQMLKGILEGCILKIVFMKPCYSQEITRSLKAYRFENISEGTLFPLLLRLEKEGYFETETMANSLGPSCKYYSLNEAWQKELRPFQRTWKGFIAIVNRILNDEVLSDEQNIQS